MHQRLISQDLSIEELFSGRYVFSIPAYHRDYVWSRGEALQLVDDIAAALDEAQLGGAARPHFLGIMLFVEQTAAAGTVLQDAGPQRVDVVDGLQRLLTLAIICAVLRDLLSGETAAALDRLLLCPGLERVYQLQLRAADAEFLRSAIQSLRATGFSQSPAVIGQSLARQNIDLARRAIRARFQIEKEKRDLEDFATFMCRHTRVRVDISNDADYAYHIFLTTNDRGKRLTVEDIFRGEILGPLEAEQRQRYSGIIEQMDRYMEPLEKKRGRGRTFFTHLQEIHGWTGRAIVSGLRLAVARQGGPRRFAAEVFAPMADTYLAIKTVGDNGSAGTLSPEVRHWLTALSWLEQLADDDWVSVAMLAMTRLDRNGPELPRFLSALDRFAHGMLALGSGHAARQRFYRPVLTALSADSLPADPAALLKFSAADEAFIVKTMATRLLNRDLHLARLVLLRLDAELSARPLSYYIPLVAPDLPAGRRLTVERVCPQGDLKHGEWVRQFPRRARRIAMSECIGNLVLVTHAQASYAAQGNFAAKKWVYVPEGEESPFYLTEILRNEPVWDAAAIEYRYDLIMQAAKQLWSFDGLIPRCPATEIGHGHELDETVAI